MSKSRVGRASALYSSTSSKLLSRVKSEDDLDFQYTVVPSESQNFEN